MTEIVELEAPEYEYAEIEPNDSELPEYGVAIAQAPPAPIYSGPETEHGFSLLSDKGHTLLTLKVRSSAPPSSLPTYFEGQPIRGKVVLHLQKPESIRLVSVSVRGAARFSRSDERPFVEVTETLFKNEAAAPSGSRGLFAGITGGAVGEKWTEGNKEFDFQVLLPPEVIVDKERWDKFNLDDTPVRLPPSPPKEAWSWSFFYEIVVIVKRSGLLAMDYTLRQTIGYTPVVKAPEPSRLRMRSYREGSPLPGPVADPSGWQVFPPIEIRGEAFKAQKVTATYSIAIATPLAYAAGSILPFFLTVESDNEQTLALLSDPSAPDVSIRRKIKIVPGVGDVGGTLLFLRAEEGERAISTVVWKSASSSEQFGWTSSRTNKRVLYGEMKLPNASTLRPSFNFGDFQMKYRIEMWAPTVTGFVPEDRNRLFKTDVQICSVHHGGPRRSFLSR